jgi:hypothetical protein
VLRRQRTTSASSLSVSGKELVPSSWWWSVRFLRRSVRGEYQIGGPTLCASAPSHRYHAMPPRRTRNSDRPRASDRTMVATKSNRLPSFKNQWTLSPRENETKGTEEQARAKPLERSRGISRNSGLDIETKNFSATGRRRSFFVDIPFDRTTYLNLRSLVIMPVLDTYPTESQVSWHLGVWLR